MPPLTDPIVKAQFLAVLANWGVTGYVTAKDLPLEWIAANLGGLTLKDVAKAMYDHVGSGEVIDQVPEHRPEWNTWPYHYDFRLRFGTRDVYLETILQDDDPKDPTIHIVSIHNV
jgi:hypothetical protein